MICVTLHLLISQDGVGNIFIDYFVFVPVFRLVLHILRHLAASGGVHICDSATGYVSVLVILCILLINV